MAPVDSRPRSLAGSLLLCLIFAFVPSKASPRLPSTSFKRTRLVPRQSSITGARLRLRRRQASVDGDEATTEAIRGPVGKSKDPLTAFFNAILPQNSAGAGKAGERSGGEEAAVRCASSGVAKATGLSVDEMARRVREGLEERSWFVSGKVDASLFSDDFAFSDPSVSAGSLVEYASGVARFFNAESFMKVIFAQPLDDNTIQISWWLSARVNLPWKPRIKPYIVNTIYKLDDQGLVCYQRDYFAIPDWDIALSAVVAGVGAAPALRPPDLSQKSKTKKQSNIFDQIGEMFAPERVGDDNDDIPAVKAWTSELRSHFEGGGLSDEPNKIRQLVYSLASVPMNIDTKKLNGRWRVAWDEGVFGWKAFDPTEGGSAYQIFDTKGLSVVNAVRSSSDKFWIVAGGSFAFEEEKEEYRSPVGVRARIDWANAKAYGYKFSPPFRGTGRFEIMYLDDFMRIFRSDAGGLVVQVREDENDIKEEEEARFIKQLLAPQQT